MAEKMFKARQIIIVLLVLFTILACRDPFKDQIPQYPAGLGSYYDILYYKFDPETILTSLDRGETDLFHPMPEQAQDNLFSSGSFSWHQADYLKIVSAFNQFVQKDTLDDWSFYSMIFDRDCNDNPIGFDTAQITYFKTEKDQDYVTREIDIEPLSQEAAWGGDTHFPRPLLFGWESVDLKRLKVTTDDAFQMAEMNGGKEARLAVKNNCKILIIWSPTIDKNSWNVDYYSGATTLFKMTVDPYSSDYEILFPKK